VFLQGDADFNKKPAFFKAGRIMCTIQSTSLLQLALYPEETKHGGRSTDFASSSSGAFPDYQSSGIRRLVSFTVAGTVRDFHPLPSMHIVQAFSCTVMHYLIMYVL